MISKKGLTPSALRWLLVPLLSPLIGASLISCTTTTASVGTDEASFCGAAEPIAWSSADTGETITQVKAHNCVGLNLGCAKFVAAFHLKPEKALEACRPSKALFSDR